MEDGRGESLQFMGYGSHTRTEICTEQNSQKTEGNERSSASPLRHAMHSHREGLARVATHGQVIKHCHA